MQQLAGVPSRALRGAPLAPLAVAVLACTRIPEGRSAVDSVTVLHAKQLRAGEVQEHLTTQASPKFLFLFDGVAYDYAIYDAAALQRDMARVERFYRSKGFLDAHARVARVTHVKDTHVRVEIDVDEGPPTNNRNVTVAGIEGLPPEVAGAARRAAEEALPRGARFDEQSFDGSAARVKKILTDRGYAYATVKAQAEIDLGQHTADYGFSVAPGPPCVFGPVEIVGLGPDGSGPGAHEIPEGPMRRAIDIREGRPYSTAEIDAATQALLELQVFSTVEIVPSLPDPPRPDHVVPLTVKVEATRLRQITVGGGVEIDEIKTDLHLVGGWADHDFLGGLRNFEVSFKPGVVLYPLRINNWETPIHPLPEERLRAELRQPGLFESRTVGFVRPEINVFPLLVAVNPPSGSPVIGYREVKLPVGVDRAFFRFRRLYVALDYSFQVESPFAYLGDLDPGLETVVLSMPELVAHYDGRDNPVRPHEGFYVGGTLQVTGGLLGGTANDVRVQPELRTYVPVAHGLTFATRGSVGLLWASNYGSNWNEQLERSERLSAPFDPATTPAGLAAYQSERNQLERDMQIMYFRGFFSGGPVTNRGFPLLGVSPHGVIPFLSPATASAQVRFSCDPAQPGFQGDRCFLSVGGFTLWELQNELRADLSGPLSATFFCDMSDVSPQRYDFRFDHLHLSCGVGAAYETPVGPIRVDLGYRVQPLQVLGYPSEASAAAADPVNGMQPTILGLPLAVAIGIGQAF
jgi:outer membrane protein insertion porin family/translocation and assembly module TamA